MATKMREAAGALGEQLSELEEIIRLRLDAYFHSLIDKALRIRPTTQIGDRQLIADGATIQQSIKFTGSVKAKLDDICSFVAENQGAGVGVLQEGRAVMAKAGAVAFGGRQPCSGTKCRRLCDRDGSPAFT